MKKLFKRLFKSFIVLKQSDPTQICQSVLLVDGSFILPNNFALIIRNVKEKFKNARIVVLTFEDKKEFIKNNFPDVEVIIPDQKTMENKHRLALQLSALLNRKFKFIIISSLDIPIVLLSLFLGRCRIFLHNRWFQWYEVRQRTVLDIIRRGKSADLGYCRKNNGAKGLVKSIGRFFVILTEVNDKDLLSPVLIIDNGYTDVSHISNAVRRVQENFINSDITLLSLLSRENYFKNMFGGIKIIAIDGAGNRYGLAAAEYRLRKLKFSRILLTSLDASLVLISLLFMKSEVILYNKWHQWWQLRYKKIPDYCKGLVKPMQVIPVAVYLLINSVIILLRTFFRMKLNYLKKEER